MPANTKQIYFLYSFTVIAIGIFISVFVSSCSTQQRSLFAKRTPHEQYEDRITNAGLKETALGKLWFDAASKAISQPVTISLPYKETGYFAADQPTATGYRFTARKGELIAISITNKTDTGFSLFIDLWQPLDNSNPRLLASADTSNNRLDYEIENNGNYLLRMQPELLTKGAYTLTVTAAPSLAFPVPSLSHPNIGSFWGASRDAGARKHEGIDIFGAFRTPVVAATDGYITGVNENRLGGKTVWLRPNNKNYTLYYAHLDSQIAVQGQQVKTGDVIGLMGNTGNAKFTPTHLHFGIYTSGGAVDPLPFVDAKHTQPANITASLSALNKYVSNNKPATIYTAPNTTSGRIATVKKNTVFRVQAAAASWYKLILADGRQGYISSAQTTVVTNPVQKLSFTANQNLPGTPDSTTR